MVWQFVQMVARIISVDEVAFAMRRTNAIIRTSTVAKIECSRWLTVIVQPLVVTGPVRLKIRRHTMFRAGLAMITQAVHRIAPGAILKSDRVPVAGRALITAHRRATT